MQVPYQTGPYSDDDVEVCPSVVCTDFKWSRSDSNRQPPACDAGALPIEQPPHNPVALEQEGKRGPGGSRTHVEQIKSLLPNRSATGPVPSLGGRQNHRRLSRREGRRTFAVAWRGAGWTQPDRLSTSSLSRLCNRPIALSLWSESGREDQVGVEPTLSRLRACCLTVRPLVRYRASMAVKTTEGCPGEGGGRTFATAGKGAGWTQPDRLSTPSLSRLCNHPIGSRRLVSSSDRASLKTGALVKELVSVNRAGLEPAVSSFVARCFIQFGHRSRGIINFMDPCSRVEITGFEPSPAYCAGGVISRNDSDGSYDGGDMCCQSE